MACVLRNRVILESHWNMKVYVVNTFSWGEMKMLHVHRKVMCAKNIFKIFMNVGTCWNFSNFIPHSLLRSQYDVVVVYLLTFALPTHVFLRDFKRGFDYILKWIRAVTHISLDYFLRFSFELIVILINIMHFEVYPYTQ